MKFIIIALVLCLFTMPASAMNPDKTPDDLKWDKRVLLLFVPDEEAMDLYDEQQTIIQTNQESFDERDFVVMMGGSENWPVENYDIDPDKFTVVLIGKDGMVKSTWTKPVTTEELFPIVDAMPMRQREMKENAQ